MSILKKIRFEVVLFLLITTYTFISLDLDIGIKNLFERINYSPVISTSSLYGNIYLEKFFINITVLGNSVWYFSFIIFSLIILYTNQKLNLYEIKNHNEKINLFISAFVYLLATSFLLFTYLSSFFSCSLRIAASTSHILKFRPNSV